LVSREGENVDTIEFKTNAEVAETLHISKRHVLYLARKLSVGIKVGHRFWIFSADDIEAMRNRNTKPGPVSRNE